MFPIDTGMVFDGTGRIYYIMHLALNENGKLPLLTLAGLILGLLVQSPIQIH